MDAIVVCLVALAASVLFCVLGASLLLKRWADRSHAPEGRIVVYWRHVIASCLVVLGALGPLALRVEGPGRGGVAFSAGLCLLVAWAIWHREAVRWFCVPAALILFASEFLRP